MAQVTDLRQMGVEDSSEVTIKKTGASETPNNIEEFLDEIDTHCDAFFDNF